MKKQVAIVTGAARGIGRAIAERLLSDHWHVTLADTDAASLRATAKALGVLHNVLSTPCDVSNERHVKRTVALTIKRFGRLDGLVNNAGIADPYSGFDAARWRRIIDVNLSGAFYFAKEAAAHLKKTRGSIVNVSSIRAFISEPNTPAYAASKGGLIALTHALAITLGPATRVNCISPGWIHTGNAPLRKKDHAQHPVGRVGEPKDVAALAAYLMSHEAGFVSGQNFVIDGGITRKMIYAE